MSKLMKWLAIGSAALLCTNAYAMTKESSWSNHLVNIIDGANMHASVLADGNYVFAQNINGDAPALVIMDTTGGVVDHVTVGISSASTYGFDIDNDGNYLLAGGVRSSLNGDPATYKQAYIAKIDAALNIVNEVAYSLTPQEQLAEAGFYAIESDLNGNYYGLYFEYSVVKSVHVVKFDNALTPLASVDLSLSEGTWGDIKMLSDGNVLVAYSDTLQVLDSELNVVSSQVYPEYRFKEITLSDQEIFVTASIGTPVTGNQSIAQYDPSTLLALDEYILSPVVLEPNNLEVVNSVVLNGRVYVTADGDNDATSSDIYVYELAKSNLSSGIVSEVKIGGSGWESAGPIMVDNNLKLISTATTRSLDGDFPEDDSILGSRIATTTINVDVE